MATNEARCLLAIGRDEEARELIVGALSTTLEWWPEDDPRALRTMLALALAAGDSEEVERLVGVLTLRLGAGHDEVATAQLGLAELFVDVSAWERALEVAERAGVLFSDRPADWRAGHAALIRAEALVGLGRGGEASGSIALAERLLRGAIPGDDPLFGRLSRLADGSRAARD